VTTGRSDIPFDLDPSSIGHDAGILSEKTGPIAVQGLGAAGDATSPIRNAASPDGR
jgi:hypothetical protein